MSLGALIEPLKFGIPQVFYFSGKTYRRDFVLCAYAQRQMVNNDKVLHDF